LKADPRLQLELVDPRDDREGCAHGAFGVVLVRDRDAEGRHDGVARELLHGAAVDVDAARDRFEERRHTTPHDLRVGAGDELRRGDEIDEENGRKLALHSLSVRRGRAVTVGGGPSSSMAQYPVPKPERGIVASTCCW
jgi:hypothetical protein